MNTTLHHLQSRLLIWIKEGSGYLPVRLFRNYATFSLVVATSLLVSSVNWAEGENVATFFSGASSKALASDRASSSLRLAIQSNKEKNLTLVPLANQEMVVENSQKAESTVADETFLSPLSQMYLATATGAAAARDPEEDGGVKIYTVQPGDTVSGIAAKNGITVNTILWANDLDDVDSIKPGDQIFILPVAGFKYVVKSGDTLDSIVAKYQSNKDRIIAYNGLPANGELVVGKEIILPDGVKETPPRQPSQGIGLERRQYATTGGGLATDITPDFSRPKEGKAGQGHRFPYGYCTWYVAQKRYVPWRGNAGAWLFNARAYGYKTGRVPKVGSIVVTTENRYYGHVALVEKVSTDTITVSEMNYAGWAKKTVRQIAKNSKVIRGYIY